MLTFVKLMWSVLYVRITTGKTSHVVHAVIAKVS